MRGCCLGALISTNRFVKAVDKLGLQCSTQCNVNQRQLVDLGPIILETGLGCKQRSCLGWKPDFSNSKWNRTFLNKSWTMMHWQELWCSGKDCSFSCCALRFGFPALMLGWSVRCENLTPLPGSSPCELIPSHFTKSFAWKTFNSSVCSFMTLSSLLRRLKLYWVN